MTDDAELRAMRAEIDRCNRDLRDVLQRRARLVRRIAQHKRARGLPLVDPAREQSMLETVLAGDDAGGGFDRDELARAFRGLLACYRDFCVRCGREV